ncbi:hypothetical protein WL57_17755 [Burkholderia cepacia]|nr:hypothetical protein WL57_17755 [Burkholderia cepacia]
MRRVPPRRARGDRACGHVAARYRVSAAAREAVLKVSGGGMARVDLKHSDTFIFRTPTAPASVGATRAGCRGTVDAGQRDCPARP